MEKEDYGLAIFVVLFLLCVIFFAGYVFGVTSDIHSKEIIQPDLKIEIQNGVADTTFIYKIK